MRVRGLVLILVGVIVFLGCAGGAAAQAPAAEKTAGPADAKSLAEALSWNRKPLLDGEAGFRFAIVADNTGGARPGVFQDAVAKLNILHPAFVMCVGDLIEGYAENETELGGMWDEFLGMIGGLDAPFFGTVGNHDVSDEMMTAYLQRRLGPPYYSFVYEDVLFMALNSQDDPTREDAYRSGLGEAQVQFVAKTLADHANVRWTFVFMHQPLFTGGEYAIAPGWDKVEAMLSGRPHTVFAGHWHEYARHDVKGHVYYRLATTGGDSALDGAERGSFDQIVWVTMTKDGPVVANLALGGIYPDDVATEQTTLAYESFASGGVVALPSIVTGERSFTAGKTAVEMRNDTDYPLTARARFVGSEALVADPSEVEASIGPHSTKAVEVSLAAPTPVDPESLPPITVEWSGLYDVPGKKPIEGSGKSLAIVDRVHDCLKTAAQITVDGDLSEWGPLTQHLTAPMEFTSNAPLWEGPQDASLSFAVTHDDGYLYLAFAVTDDRIVIDDEHNARQEDALTILVDARSASARAVPSSDWKPFVYFVLSPATAPGGEELGELLPEGAKVASVITPAGYNTEIAIPAALLDKAAGGPYKDFRLNVRLHDLDTTGYDVTPMWWRPAWNGPRNYPGSGTFRRE